MEHFKTPSLTGSAALPTAGSLRPTSKAKRAAFHGLPKLDRSLYDTLFRLDAGRRHQSPPDVPKVSRVALSCPAERGAPQDPDPADQAAAERRSTLINRVLALTAIGGTGRKPMAKRIKK